MSKNKVVRLALATIVTVSVLALCDTKVRNRILLRRIDAPLSDFFPDLKRGGRQYSYGAIIREEKLSSATLSLWDRVLGAETPVWEDRISAHVPRWIRRRMPGDFPTLHGPYREFSSGVVTVSGNFDYAKAIGVWTLWRPDGTILGQVNQDVEPVAIRTKPPWWTVE